jgi:hypothetical protein
VDRCSPSSDDTLLILDDRGGMVERGVEVDVVCLVSASGAQQKDSRENNRQLRFSNRLPSSIA